MKKNKNPYDILGVDKNADKKEIKKQYRKKLKKITQTKAVVKKILLK